MPASRFDCNFEIKAAPQSRDQLRDENGAAHDSKRMIQADCRVFDYFCVSLLPAEMHAWICSDEHYPSRRGRKVTGQPSRTFFAMYFR
jgi:hypothetical protein